MLTVMRIRSLKPAERPYKVADTDGLYLLVQPAGALLWRYRYRCCGIERKLSLGSFADIALSPLEEGEVQKSN
ncbi:Arm DNA-binding domain-containing protein, partial [Sphingomonas sp. CCH20-B6]